MACLRVAEPLAPADSKSYRRHRFIIEPGSNATILVIRFRYDRGGELPHNLVTLSLFDPAGFRGAGHRFAPRQEVRVALTAATPGFVPGPIAAGEWWVELDLHCVLAAGSYELVVETTTGVPTPPPLRLAAAPAAPPRGPSPRWHAGELHVHSTHSDGRWSTDDIAAAARGRGLDFLFLTDHNTVTGIEALRRACGGALVVHAGQELTTFRGHALALGPEQWLDWRTGLDRRTINDVVAAVRAAGGVTVVAHPDAMPDPICTGCQWTHADLEPAGIDAVEIWGGLWDGAEERNEGCVAQWHRWLNEGHRLAATAATDAHKPEDWRGEVPLTYVWSRDASLPEVLTAIRAGRTYVSSGPTLSLQAFGAGDVAAGLGDTAHAVRSVEAICSDAPAAAELRLVVDGAVRATAAANGAGSVSVSAGLYPGERWCTAELWRGSIGLAFTSPIYLAAP